ncbi:MAG: SGNH/GDSL hydrolase family protein [Rhodospirillales bacterium]
MLKNSLLVLASLVLAVGMAEAGLRLAGIAYPEFNRLDPELGWSPRPNTEGFHALEGRAWIKINAEGFRDIDHDTAKPAGTFRIAVLGDSFAEGREVPLEQVFWKVLERKLGACPQTRNRKIETLGFAVNGYGTAQEFLVLKKHVWKYRPDAVLLTVFTGNDILNNSRELDRHPDRPYFALKNNQLILQRENLDSDSFRTKKFITDIKHGIYNKLRTLQLTRQAYKKIRYGLAHENRPLIEQLNAGLNAAVFAPPTTPDWDTAWRITERLIGMAAHEIRQHPETAFWIATLSAPAQVYPNPAVRAEIARSLGVPDLRKPDRRIAALAEKLGVPAVSLVHDLAAYAETHKTRLHGNAGFAGGHWNAAGHRIAGERLATALCGLLGRP